MNETLLLQKLSSCWTYLRHFCTLDRNSSLKIEDTLKLFFLFFDWIENIKSGTLQGDLASWEYLKKVILFIDTLFLQELDTFQKRNLEQFKKEILYIITMLDSSKR